MSKLGDAIRRSQRIESAPIGFGASREPAKPTMVVAALAQRNTDVAALKEAGAEVVIIDARSASLDDAAAKKLASQANGVALGLLAGGLEPSRAQELKEAGFDFLVVDAESTPAATLLDDDLGYALVLPAGADETFLRSLEPLSLEGLFLERLPWPLTVARQLELNRAALLARKPLLCLLEVTASADDLRALRAAGCALVAISGGAEAVKQLKATVAGLPPRRRRREERSAVALPRGQTQLAEDDDDDDDDDRWQGRARPAR